MTAKAKDTPLTAEEHFKQQSATLEALGGPPLEPELQADALERAEATLQAVADLWKAESDHLLHFGGPPLAPAEMIAWLDERARLIDRIEQLRDLVPTLQHQIKLARAKR